VGIPQPPSPFSPFSPHKLVDPTWSTVVDGISIGHAFHSKPLSRRLDAGQPVGQVGGASIVRPAPITTGGKGGAAVAGDSVAISIDARGMEPH
jgi:hypothetical protein